MEVSNCPIHWGTPSFHPFLVVFVHYKTSSDLHIHIYSVQGLPATATIRHLSRCWAPGAETPESEKGQSVGGSTCKRPPSGIVFMVQWSSPTGTSPTIDQDLWDVFEICWNHQAVLPVNLFFFMFFFFSVCNTCHLNICDGSMGRTKGERSITRKSPT